MPKFSNRKFQYNPKKKLTFNSHRKKPKTKIVKKKNRKHKPKWKRSQNAKKKLKNDVDMNELMDIFKQSNNNKRNRRSKRSTNADEHKISLKMKMNEKKREEISSETAIATKDMSKKQLLSLKNKRQLRALPKNIKIPKCMLCHQKMLIERGDMCYEGYISVTCDYCGRSDIHGEVWNCPKGFVSDDKHSGFNLCKTCGFLITNGRQREIRRVCAPSTDDTLGMNLSRNRGMRIRRRTEDGCIIYKYSEITSALKIGINSGSTNLCPFDCDCCF